jgi:hypothetical protein
MLKGFAPEIYVAYSQFPQSGATLIVRRARGDALLLSNDVTGRIAALDPAVAVTTVRRVADSLAATYGDRRALAWLLAVFAALALGLTGLGIGSVVSFSVAQRTSEIGIRMALGADAGEVLRLIIRGALGPVLVGEARPCGARSAVARGSALRVRRLADRSALDRRGLRRPARRGRVRGLRSRPPRLGYRSADRTQELLMSDFRHALRVLRRRPAFTLVAVLTLGLGIGANTAIFSVVNGVLLRPLPFPEPDRIVRLWEQTRAGGRNNVSNPNFLDWRARATSFEALSAYRGGTETVLGGRDAVFAEAYIVTDGFFRVLGVPPGARPHVRRGRDARRGRAGGGRRPPILERDARRADRSLATARDHRRRAGAGRRRHAGRLCLSGRRRHLAPKELVPDTSGRTANNDRVIGRLKTGRRRRRRRRRI